jgi:hypothetical protein
VFAKSLSSYSRIKLPKAISGQSMKGMIIAALVLCAAHMFCSRIDVSTSSEPSQSCPSYTHKEDVQIGNQQDLPEGFFVFDRDTIPGLYKSPLREFRSSLIPNTKNAFPRSISISNNGQWIFYVDSKTNVPYLIRGNGCYKTIVPTTGVSLRSLCPGGFYRNSPYGDEIFYVAGTQIVPAYHAGKQEIHALKVTFTANGPVFGNDRTIAMLSSLYLNPDYTIGYAVSRDQIFGEIGPILNDSTSIERTGFLTIPGNGTGIATDANIYKWANDDYHIVVGCGHTMSFDGQFVLANAGPHFGKPPWCIPTGHKGFYVAPFRRDSDPPLDQYTEHLLKFGISLNWCPEQYRIGDYDFWGWYFTNSNSYVAGRMISRRGNSGGWMVDWQNNTWTMLCPPDSNIRIQQPAAYIGAVDTGNLYIDIACQGNDTLINPGNDSSNPVYTVVSPNGGEIFHGNETCTVKVSSARPGNAILFLLLDNGRYNVMLSTEHSFNPQKDSLFIFVIPDTFDMYGTKVSSVSDSCIIRIEDYSTPTQYYDESDGYFQIVP